MHDDAHGDRRQSPRSRTLLGATIQLDNKLSTFACKVRSRSDDGLLIELENTGPIPDTFSLVVGPQKLRCRCRVVWRKANRLGVQITGIAGDADDGSPPAGGAAATATDIAERLAATFPHLARKP